MGWLILATISGLNRLPKYQGTVYFGASLSLDDFLPLLKVGKTFSQKNFTSTSLKLSVAGGFATKELSQGMGAFYFTIENSKYGANIAPYSYWNEDEVLFLPLQPFRVKSIQQQGTVNGNYPKYEVVLVEI